VYGQGNRTGFGPPVTPPIVRNLIIANAAVFIAQLLLPGLLGFDAVTRYGAVSAYGVWHEWNLWQPFTYMWLHSPGSIWHIVFNMFSLWMFGSAMALAWGEQRFLKYYLYCGVGAGLLICTVPMIPAIMGLSSFSWASVAIPTLGASGAVMGVLLAYSFTWPDRTIQLIFPPIPIKAIWLIPLLLMMEFTSGPSNVSHLGHLGGLAIGWCYLQQEGRTPNLPTINNLKLRFRRHKMRQNLRAVQDEEREARRRDRDDHHLH
jgi:membrane associated rhomboid family serine protease